jgi:Family of unknown function (DUF6448)
MKHPATAKTFILASLLLAAPIGIERAYAHCDGMDGPVVKAARQALAAGDVNLVLVWVQSKDDAEVRKAFLSTQAVRKLNPEARELADLYFFETVVRIHRAGEGEPYTGLKPAGRDLGPAIPAADRAIETGSVDSLAKTTADAARQGVRDRFQRVLAQKSFAKEDLTAGRKYVKAYVEFIHYVEGLHEAIQHGGHEHSREPEAKEIQ